MTKYRDALPQAGCGYFLTDGGLETTLIFLEGQELPHFAAFHMLKSAAGENLLRKYFAIYAELAARYRAGIVLETATWRANRDWAEKLGYDAGALAEVNRRSVLLVEEVRENVETPATPVVISGCVGPRGDGYVPGSRMSADEAEDYHSFQVQTFADTGADLVSGLTLNYVEEALGLTRAARQAGMPVVISFTLETNGRLPTGQPLGSAIQEVDEATSLYPSYYMINCAHPSHFGAVAHGDEPWLARVRGLRVNASRMSHSELNEAPGLDAGNPEELGHECHGLLREPFRHVNVLGGCCGTDHRHVEQITAACLPLFHGTARRFAS